MNSCTDNDICLPTISNSNKVLSHLMLSYLILCYFMQTTISVTLKQLTLRQYTFGFMQRLEQSTNNIISTLYQSWVVRSYIWSSWINSLYIT